MATRRTPGTPQRADLGHYRRAPTPRGGKRVVATLVDRLIPFVIVGIATGIAFVIGFGTADCTTTSYRTDPNSGYNHGGSANCEVTSVNAAAYIVIGIAALIGTIFIFWNLYREGKTGSTVGKSLMKFKVVSENDGQPIGFLLCFVRQLAHIVDNVICYIGYLFPLWDSKRQTLADKIMSTVCVPSEGATGTR